VLVQFGAWNARWQLIAWLWLPSICVDVSDDSAGDDAITSDSACLMSMIMVSEILEEGERIQRMQAELNGVPRPSMKRNLVCEILDPRTDRLLKRNSTLSKAGLFFRSNLIETGMFSMAATEPLSFNVLQLLMSPGDGHLAAVPLSSYVQTAGELICLSFWDIHDLVRLKGDIVTGWIRQDGRSCLCPCDEEKEVQHKEVKLQWSGEEKLVVIRRPLVAEEDAATAQPGIAKISTVRSLLQD